MVFYIKQQFKKAEEYYLTCLRIDPHNKLANFNLGVLYVRLEKFKEGWFYREKKRRIDNTLNNQENDKSWDGKYVDGILYVKREQGVGDEISFLSMVHDLCDKAKFIYLEIDGLNCIDETSPYNVSEFTTHTNETNGRVTSSFAKANDSPVNVSTKFFANIFPAR